MVTIYIFTLGLIVGSFINATAGRWGTSRQNASRSKCFQCGIVLSWRDLIPLYSWVAARGRCRSCYCHVSWRYPIIEIFTGGLFVLAAMISTSYLMLGINLLIFSLLIVLTLTDLDQFIIPHEFSLPLIAISLIGLWFNFETGIAQIPTISHILAGPILAGFFWSLWYLTGGRGMGFADGTLALSIGWFLGLVMGISAVMLAFWIGTAISLGMIAWQKFNKSYPQDQRLGMKSAVPFGPFLVIGFLVVYIAELRLFF